MPDWSYRTIVRPVLLGLHPERARRIAVGALSRFGNNRIGRVLIDFLGHMRADGRLSKQFAGCSFPGPVGIGSLLDPEGRALNTFGSFGCGFLVIGPIAEKTCRPVDWEVDVSASRIMHRGAEPTVSVAEAATALSKRVHLEVPVFARMENANIEMIRRIAPYVDGLIIPHSDISCLEEMRSFFRGMILIAAPKTQEDYADCADADGVWMDHCGEISTGKVQKIRSALGDKIIVCSGITSPAQAREILESGASLVCVEAGLALSGPGLVKRTNEALLSLLPAPTPEPLTLDAARMSWFWSLMLGIAMLAGGIIAVVLSAGRVILPYDEALCGIPRGAFEAINPRLLPFMAHDRMTLAGTMLSIGILYTAIAWSAVRRGQHWAKNALVLSSGSGFFSFFLFLGFGYFDPFHAFITAVVVQFVFFALYAPLGESHPPRVADWNETPEWRRGQWGQLLFILMGVGLCGAGLVISYVGCTSVFVETDLEFLRIAAAKALVGTDKLIPLIAHDRASLGGMLISNGIIIWLASQWGIRAGARWLWNAFAMAGNVAFATAVGVHIAVGYTSWLHLVPALVAWIFWNIALALTRGWMCRSAG